MGDWIGLGIILLVVIIALVAMSYGSQPREISVEEFEKRAREGPGLLSAGVVGLQKMLDPSADKAMQTQSEMRKGIFNRKQASGDGGKESNDAN